MKTQEYILRVTLVYRVEASDWDCAKALLDEREQAVILGNKEAVTTSGTLEYIGDKSE